MSSDFEADTNERIAKLYAETMALSFTLAEIIRLLRRAGLSAQAIFDAAAEAQRQVAAQEAPSSPEVAEHHAEIARVISELRGMVLGHESLPSGVRAN